MRKVLIVSPRFPPINTPDLHRVRMSLPYYRKFGWEPTVLCATPETSDGVLDEALERTVPEGIRVERVRAWPEAACRRIGFGHFNYRCMLPLYRRGSDLLAQERYEAVFFSTTAFPTFVLGPRWRRKYGCRIVYDFQDPWRAGESKIYDRSTAPGGMLKYKLSTALAMWLEPVAMRGADHVITVSGRYVEALRSAYAWLGPEQFTVMPFGAPTSDFELLARDPVPQRVFDRGDGLVHFVSIGRGGPDMFPVLDRFFAVVAQLRAADAAWNRVRFHFVGTNYSPAAITYKVVAPLADARGVADLVDEQPGRIPYLESLQVLKESHGVLLVGSIFPDYTPSKLFSCALAGRPVLAMLHAGSLASGLAPRFGNLRLATFDSAPQEAGFSDSLREGLGWLHALREERNLAQNGPLDEYSAEAMTRAQCRIFEAPVHAEAPCPA